MSSLVRWSSYGMEVGLFMTHFRVNGQTDVAWVEGLVMLKIREMMRLSVEIWERQAQEVNVNINLKLLVKDMS